MLRVQRLQTDLPEADVHDRRLGRETLGHLRSLALNEYLPDADIDAGTYNVTHDNTFSQTNDS
jgi:hypothetical protein